MKNKLLLIPFLMTSIPFFAKEITTYHIALSIFSKNNKDPQAIEQRNGYKKESITMPLSPMSKAYALSVEKANKLNAAMNIIA